jgi:integrase
MEKKEDFFKVQMKGDTAMIIAYDKCFSNHRFLWSTGIHDSTINPDRPPKKVKRFLEIAQQAFESLGTNGQPINNETLKHRIELIRDRIAWIDNELHIWTKDDKAEYFMVPDMSLKEGLNKALKAEGSKAQPNYSKVVDGFLNQGRRQLIGYWKNIVGWYNNDGTWEVEPDKSNSYTERSLSGKRQTLKVILDYQEATGVNLTFQSMDNTFYKEFVRWLKASYPNKSTGQKGLDGNTIWKHTKELKAMLHRAYADELIDNTRFEYWSAPQDKNEIVTLTKDELLDLLKIELTNDTKRNVLDIFLMACFLGPRISDFKSLKPESFYIKNGIQYFQYVQEKTQALCEIPVHHKIQEIMNRRKGIYPKMIAEQNFRSYLKEILKASDKLNYQVITKIRKGAKQNEVIKKDKWDAISPHSARRTFATALYYGWFGKPMPSILCMYYTGHKTEKSFLAYIGASDKDKATKALEYFDVKPYMQAS